MIDESIRLRLLAESDIADLVEDKIYANKAPQTAVRPFVVYRLLNETEDSHANGASGLETCSIEFDCEDENRSGESGRTIPRQTAKAIWDNLKGFRGLLDEEFFLSGAFKQQGSDDELDPPADASDSGIFHKVLTLTLWYRQVSS